MMTDHKIHLVETAPEVWVGICIVCVKPASGRSAKEISDKIKAEHIPDDTLIIVTTPHRELGKTQETFYSADL